MHKTTIDKVDLPQRQTAKFNKVSKVFIDDRPRPRKEMYGIKNEGFRLKRIQ